MKTARSLLLCLAALAFLGATLLRAEDWKTTDGKTYQDVKVVSSTPESVTILHKDGGAKVPLSNVTPDVQKRFNYDSDKAKAYVAEQAKAREPKPKLAPAPTVASATGAAPSLPFNPSKPTEGHTGSPTLSEKDLKELQSALSSEDVDAILNGNSTETDTTASDSSDSSTPAATQQAPSSKTSKVFASTDPNHHSQDDLVNSITNLRHDLSDPTYHTMAHFALEAQSLGPDPNDKSHHTMDEISGH